MKKETIGTLCTALFLGAFLFSTYFVYTYLEDKWLAFIIGGVILLTSGVFSIVASIKDITFPKQIGMLLMVINGIGMSCVTGALLIHYEIVFDDGIIVNLIGTYVISMVLYILYYQLMNIDLIDNHLIKYSLVYLVFMIGIAVALWLLTQMDLLVVISFFVMIFMMLGLIIKTNSDKEIWTNFTNLSIGALAVIAVIALIILSEGDVGDIDLDLPIEGIED